MSGFAIGIGLGLKWLRPWFLSHAGGARAKDEILMESGDKILMESGDNILTEKQ